MNNFVTNAVAEAVWVAGYDWVSSYTATQTSSIPVPYTWLAAYDPEIVDEFDIYESAAQATAANGRKVWECYVLGLNPNDATNDFRITSFSLDVHGMPYIKFEPPQDKWNVPSAKPVVQGTENLTTGDWQDVLDGGNPNFRFFKVKVKLP